MNEYVRTTEDGIDIFENSCYWIIKDDGTKDFVIAEKGQYLDHVAFVDDDKADEYIWRNQRLFSYRDIIKHMGEIGDKKLRDLAKDRIKKINN